MLDNTEDFLDSDTFSPMEILADAMSHIQNTDISSISLANASQAQLELLYSKYQTQGCIAQEFLEAGIEAQLEAVNIPLAFGLDLLVQLVLHKRANIPTLVGMLKRHFDDQENPAQACTDMILKACEEDLADWDEFTQTVVMLYNITPDVQAKIDQFQFPLPMIEPPQPVTNNKQTGYLTIKKSILLRNNHHDEDVCLDHINRANQTPLAVNADVVAFVQNRWKNLDKPKPGESREKFLSRKKAFAKYDRVSREVIDALLAQGNRFWLTHRYDKRGRVYCTGYHATYQGNDWSKAIIEFADKEVLR